MVLVLPPCMTVNFVPYQLINVFMLSRQKKHKQRYNLWSSRSAVWKMNFQKLDLRPPNLRQN